MKKLLEQLLYLGTEVSAQSEDMGMASVKLLWNPYTSRWEAEMSWSNNEKIFCSTKTPKSSLQLLKFRTERHIKRINV